MLLSILAFARKGAKRYRFVEVTPLGILAGTRLWLADQNNAPRVIEQGVVLATATTYL